MSMEESLRTSYPPLAGRGTFAAGLSDPNSWWEHAGLLKDSWELLRGVVPSRYAKGLGRVWLKGLLAMLVDRQLLESIAVLEFRGLLICLVLTNVPFVFILCNIQSALRVWFWSFWLPLRGPHSRWRGLVPS